MPTRRSVDIIKANILRPALTSHYEVEFALPNDREFQRFLDNNGVAYFTNQEKLRLLCSEATLPGSNLATLELTNDHTGVTERHAYRRVYDDRIDFTFYVDQENYFPIHFFEVWMKFIVDESRAEQGARGNVGAVDPNYFYRVRYPTEYMAKKGTKVIKFERDYKTKLEYEFINAFPISVSSMPISYDSSSLLKCTVSMSYIRYILNKADTTPTPDTDTTKTVADSPNKQAEFNTIPNYFLNPQFGVQRTAEGPIYNDFLNADIQKDGKAIGNPRLDQFGVQLPQGTRNQLGITGAVIGA